MEAGGWERQGVDERKGKACPNQMKAGGGKACPNGKKAGGGKAWCPAAPVAVQGAGRGLLATSEMQCVQFQTRNTNVQNTGRQRRETRERSKVGGAGSQPGAAAALGEVHLTFLDLSCAVCGTGPMPSAPARLLRLASGLPGREPGEHVLPDAQPLESDSGAAPSSTSSSRALGVGRSA